MSLFHGARGAGFARPGGLKDRKKIASRGHDRGTRGRHPGRCPPGKGTERFGQGRA